jgi:hypothetical protein
LIYASARKIYFNQPGISRQGHEALEQDDLPQVSEKGWGAATQMVKAVAEQEGWQHNGHAYLFQVVRQLADETWDNQLVRLFQIANSLHINFYENWIPKESVRESLVAVQEFVEKTEGLLR